MTIKMLLKPALYRVRGSLYNCMHTLIHVRARRVLVERHFPSPTPVTSGVPPRSSDWLIIIFGIHL